jgi:phenylacetate-CoA ligase
MIGSCEDVAIARRRQEHFSHLGTVMRDLVGRLDWTREQIDAQRTLAFRVMLKHLKRHSPWHAKRVRHIDADRATLKDLGSIPVMTKADLMAHWDEIVTVEGATLAQAQAALQSMTDHSYVWGHHVLLASGGTGGRPGVFLYDWNAMAVNWGSMSRTVAQIPLQRPGERRMVRRAAIVAEPSAHGSYVMSRIFSNPANPTLLLSSWRSLDDIVPQLNMYQPEVLSCYPTLVPDLAAAVRRNALAISPSVILFVSEHLSQQNYHLAKELWPDSRLLTMWGTSEGGATFPCRLGGGAFHVSEDLVVIEPADASASLSATGSSSEGIYLTNLFNYALPIIRYYIDDIFDVSPQPCPCGSAYQRVNEVRGRVFEKFVYDTIHVHPLRVELAVLEQTAILAYQIRQTPHGVHIVYSASGEVDKERLARGACAALMSYGLIAPNVQLEEVTTVARTPAGKLRRFVPLAGRALDASPGAA